MLRFERDTKSTRAPITKLTCTENSALGPKGLVLTLHVCLYCIKLFSPDLRIKPDILDAVQAIYLFIPGRYGFHKEAEGGKDEPGMKKDRLLGIFNEWTDMVTDLVKATPEDDILRRDIFDRPPILS